MKLLFPLKVVAGRAIVDRAGNIVATVHARRVLDRPYDNGDGTEDAIEPVDADENAREIVRLLNAAAEGGL